MKLINFIKESIKYKIVLGIIILLILPLLVVYYYSYNSIEAVMINETNQHTLDILSQTDQKVTDILDSLINASNLIAYDENIIKLINDSNYNNLDDFSKLKRIQQIENIIINVRNSQLKYRYNCNFIVISEHGEIYGPKYDMSNDYITREQMLRLNDLKNEEWYKEVIASKGYFQWIAPHTNYLNDKGPMYISLGRAIIDPVSYKPLGVVLISISTIDFGNELRNMIASESSKVFIMNSQGLTVYSNASMNQGDDLYLEAVNEVINESSFENSGIRNISGKKVLLSTRSIERTGWKTIYTIPLDELFSDIYKIRIRYLFTIEGLLLIFSIFIIVFINRIIKPTQGLKKAMMSISKGNFEVQVKVKSSDELGSLASTFNTMSMKIKELISEIEQKRNYEQLLKFEALQAQINPHFLFNSLNTIKLAAETSQAYNISKMVAELGKMLKYTMDFKTEEISLNDEMNYINSYVYYYNLRYNNGISLSWEINSSLLEVKIMKFILQPIVENSIIHGFENSNFGEIRILVAKKNDILKIDVTDNGKGIDEDMLNLLSSGFDAQAKEQIKYSNIGLKNVDDRLKLKYGEKFGLIISSTAGSGTCVSVQIPVERRL